MNKKEALEKFNQEFTHFLKTEIFPQELLPEEFHELAHVAFQFESVSSLEKSYGISFQEYKVLMMKEKNYSLFETAAICNTIEMRSPAEIARYVAKANYYTIQQAVYDINQEWKKIVDPVRESVERKIALASGAPTLNAMRTTDGANYINGKKLP
jgi:hypothetical protein